MTREVVKLTRQYKVLTKDERAQIIALQKAGRVTRLELAEKFGVHNATIGKILRESGTGRGRGNWLPRKPGSRTS